MSAVFGPRSTAAAIEDETEHQPRKRTTKLSAPAATHAVRYRCDAYPDLKVLIDTEVVSDLFAHTHYAQFRKGILDLDTTAPDYSETVSALERARSGGTPIELVGDPHSEDVDEDALAADLRRRTCTEVGCGRVSSTQAAAARHSQLHAQLAATAAE